MCIYIYIYIYVFMSVHVLQTLVVLKDHSVQSGTLVTHVDNRHFLICRYSGVGWGLQLR